MEWPPPTVVLPPGSPSIKRSVRAPSASRIATSSPETRLSSTWRTRASSSELKGGIQPGSSARWIIVAAATPALPDNISARSVRISVLTEIWLPG